MNDRLAIVVKYFPPYPRISGVLGFVSLLARELSSRGEVHVVTSALPDGVAPSDASTCVVHHVQSPFPLTALQALGRVRPSRVLVVSGVYDLSKAGAYFAPFGARAAVRRDSWFYQATWPRAKPNVLFRRSVSGFNGVLSASPAMRHLMADGGVDSGLLLPGVDVLRLAGLETRERAGFRVGFVNHLNRVKGADLALEVMRRVAAERPDTEFLIAGDGELAGQVRGGTCYMPNLEMRGYLSDSERFRMMATCDVMLLPFREATSILGVAQTALEVMAVGNVVVGSATRSLSEAIESERNGILVELSEDDVLPMVKQVLRLAADSDLLSRLKQQATEDASRRWDVRSRASELSSLMGWASGR